MPRLTLLAALLVTSVCLPAQTTSSIEPALQGVLEPMRLEQPTTVFVYLRDQVPLGELVARLDAMQATRQFRHELVVRSLRELAERTQPPVAAAIAELRSIGEVTEVVPFWIFNGFAVRGSKAAILRLAELPQVGRIAWAGSDEPGTEDAIGAEPAVGDDFVRMPAPESGLLECRADYVWAQGYTGSNAVVANIDTGVDGNHPALSSRWRGRLSGVPAIAAWFDPIANTTTPTGRSDHGTHTMGTICGDDGAGNQIGMAPGARWIASNPIDASGTRAQKNVWYNRAIQWTADPDGDPATVDDVPDVCSNSWGVRDPNNGVGPCSTVFHASIDAAEASTVVYVFAAGNEGATGPRVPADRVASPTNTFTVGALDVGSTAIASFSSRGPSTCATTNNVKPEVSARGVSVRSSIRGGGYASLSGTSMATPHVAGAVALLRDVWPELTVVRAKELLMETADDLGTVGEDNTFGWGRIDLQRAYNQLIGERPPVAIAVMGTQETVQRGQTAWAHVVVSGYSAVTERIVVSVELYFDNQPTGIYFVPPVVLDWPAGLTNRSQPLQLPISLSATLGSEFLNRPVEYRGIVRQGNDVISEARYVFTIVP
ncbi:MAG: S8 family serine peptidase [Planctomycetes bacterium]|nr:S8 family serine peptidase [Planctomycetota bacterium]